jgi:hypothetical protein
MGEKREREILSSRGWVRVGGMDLATRRTPPPNSISSSSPASATLLSISPILSAGPPTTLYYGSMGGRRPSQGSTVGAPLTSTWALLEFPCTHASNAPTALPRCELLRPLACSPDHLLPLILSLQATPSPLPPAAAATLLRCSTRVQDIWLFEGERI